MERGRALFAALGVDPYSHPDEDDVRFLVLNIEKRHVLGHNLGIADEAYLEVAESEQPGQTVRLLADEVVRFADICCTVIARLESECPEFLAGARDG